MKIFFLFESKIRDKILTSNVVAYSGDNNVYKRIQELTQDTQSKEKKESHYSSFFSSKDMRYNIRINGSHIRKVFGKYIEIKKNEDYGLYKVTYRSNRIIIIYALLVGIVPVMFEIAKDYSLSRKIKIGMLVGIICCLDLLMGMSKNIDKKQSSMYNKLISLIGLIKIDKQAETLAKIEIAELEKAEIEWNKSLLEKGAR